MPHVLFVFLDGVGLGPATVANPFATVPLPAFERLAGGQRWTAEAAPIRQPRHVFVPIDATLGLEGLPQSGTGQAALFTGENAAAVHGRHFGPYPPTTVRPLVAEQSVFARLAGAGLPTGRLAFANAYPDRFFRFVEGRGRWTVTTLAANAAGVRLRRADDLRAGRALAADLTAEGWRAFAPDLPARTEAEAAGHLAALAEGHAFTLFEYFLTDKAGHSRDAARAAAVLARLDAFLEALLDALPDGALLLLSSDHGNLEDLSTKSHTRHPVPLVAWGEGADAFAEAGSLLDVTPRIVDLLAQTL
ncbi:alkaline phosphatase family protein [Rubrivirga marina]|uniref:alkaline phosphatase family protein n=1 Tax=Rubrivirga marina TaxID=1196024 RepID=UPI001C53123A|nr:alkaline phosphatase family protein [Rubrivirga marina]